MLNRSEDGLFSSGLASCWHTLPPEFPSPSAPSDPQGCVLSAVKSTKQIHLRHPRNSRPYRISLMGSSAVEGSDEFPFEIITRSGYGLKIKETYFQRELDDEVIRVSAEYETDEDEDEDEEDEVEEDDDDDEFDDEVEEDDEEEDSGIAMKANIFQKSTGKQLKLDVTSFRDEIRVDHFSIKKPEKYYHDVTKTGGRYLANLQKELVTYLEVRD
ncbi:hypothetical protein ACLB2K_060391 [Fragaria x ananassa]